MRFVTAAVSFALTLCISASAFARSPRYVQDEVLTKVIINGEPTKWVATLHLDYIQNQIELTVWNDLCHQLIAPPGVARCMAMATPVAEFSVPLLERHSDCGSNIYTGFVDRMRVDGNRTSITVYDHTSRICENVVESLIVVEATSTNPRNFEHPTTYKLMK